MIKQKLLILLNQKWKDLKNESQSQSTATSANLGPGFDVAGLALTLYNTFTFELNEGGLNITGCPTQFCNEENLTYQLLAKQLKAVV